MGMNILDKVDPQELGHELQEARKQRGLTQEDAARLLGLSRTTITAIEKGERRIRANELITLASAYGRDVSDFVRKRPQVAEMQAQFRGPYLATEQDRSEIEPSVNALIDYARNYSELEELTGSRLDYKYPPERNTQGLKPEAAAEDAAQEERLRLGLGDGPIPSLRDLLEQEVGLRIFYLNFASNRFSAIYVYDAKLGGCIAVNRDHPEERRRLSLAHDYGHFLAHRYHPDVLVEHGYQRRPQGEIFADNFAFHFLMPSGGLKRRWNEELRKGKPKVTDLLRLANYFGVSVQALTLRLEDLGLVATGVWRSYQDRGLAVREKQAELGFGEIPARESIVPLRYQYLAVEALLLGLITEGRFAHFLGVDRVEARDIAESLRAAGNASVEDGAINLYLAQSLEQHSRK